jgi:PhnB protein
MAVKRIPAGEPQVIPYLKVREGKRALEFYAKAFGAKIEASSYTPDGKLVHGRLRFGDALFFVSDEFGPPGPEPAGVTIHLWTEDADALWARAIEAGCKEQMPLGDQFWGDRYGQLRDPFGHAWSIAHRVENLSPEQVEQRSRDFFAKLQHP